MNKKTISIILLIIFIMTTIVTVANVFIEDTSTQENQTGTLTINRKSSRIFDTRIAFCPEIGLPDKPEHPEIQAQMPEFEKGNRFSMKGK